MRHYPVHVILGFCVFSVTHRATVAQHNSIWRGWIRVRLLNRLIFFFLLVSIYIYAIWKQTGKFEVAEKGSSAKTLQLEPLLVHSPTPSICMHDTFQQYWEGKRGTSWQPQASLTYCTHLLGLNMELAHQHPLFGLFQGGFLFLFWIWKANFDAACKLHFSLQCVPRGGIWRLICTAALEELWQRFPLGLPKPRGCFRALQLSSYQSDAFK